MNYILASTTLWPLTAFLKRRPSLPGQWITVCTPEDLAAIARPKNMIPKYIFFPHWSHKVPDEIVYHFNCVGFHMGDRRGGSPLQHLIASGAAWTEVTAFRMTKDLDAGPVYLQNVMSLEGSAEDCYTRAAEISLNMIKWIVDNEPRPALQVPVGEVKILKRRRPEESGIPWGMTLSQIYNHIRMLDADGYPRAFLDYCGYRLEFRDAKMSEEGINAQVRISLRSTS